MKDCWVGTLPGSLHGRFMESKLPFILKYSVILGFHLTAPLGRASDTRFQSKLTSVVLNAKSSS